MIAHIAPQENWMSGEETAVANLVSVIIPNYNHASYLPEAIDSVLRQTHQPVEIIVVDDGSTDDSRQVAAAYGDQIRYIWHENQGLSAARNTGLRTARGEFIALLDADDMYEPTFIKEMVNILQTDRDASAAFCGYQFVDMQGNPLPQIEARKIPSADVFNSLVDGNFTVPEAWMVRRDCYLEVGPFDTNLSACEDTDMWLRISRNHKVVSIDHILTKHRVLPNSMSTNAGRQFRNRITVTNKHFGLMSEANSSENKLQMRAYSRTYLAATIEYLQANQEHEAYECFRKMAEIDYEALEDLSVFYELGFGQQPKGYRGDFSSLDLQKNSQMLFGFIERLAEETIFLASYRKRVMSNAHLAVGLIAYGKGNVIASRKHLVKAITMRPGLVVQKKTITTLIKSLPVVSMLVKKVKNSIRG